MKLKFLMDQIEDVYIRDNFKRLQDAILAEAVLKGEFKFFEIPVSKSVVRQNYSHNLNFIPKDVITLSVSADADVTWHFDEFDRTTVQFTTTKACVIRAFIGAYGEGTLR